MKVDDGGAWLEAHRRDVDALLDARLPARARDDDPGRLIEAIRYSLLAPGKRLRPMMALGAAEAVLGTEPDEPIRIACAAVELVHCYSLIHDDLPAMDDDDLRRGRPTNHRVFGEAMAILAGDALLTLAFEWIADAGETAVRLGGPLRAAHFLRASRALARGAGIDGMVSGQARDIGEGPPNTIAALEVLHREKTAALFRASLEIGAAAAGADEVAFTALGRFGELFGVAFQHADDLSDAEHLDHATAARAQVTALVGKAMATLDEAGQAVAGKSAPLRRIAASLARRS